MNPMPSTLTELSSKQRTPTRRWSPNFPAKRTTVAVRESIPVTCRVGVQRGDPWLHLQPSLVQSCVLFFSK